MQEEKQAEAEKEHVVHDVQKDKEIAIQKKNSEKGQDVRSDKDVENQAAFNAEKDAQTHEKIAPFPDPQSRAGYVNRQKDMWGSKLRADRAQKGTPNPMSVMPETPPEPTPEQPAPSILPADDNDVNSGGAP